MALVFPSSVAVQVELSGAGGGWTVLNDVVWTPGIEVDYGIHGTNPSDKVASTGVMRFQLRNGPSNSSGTQGYYSPDHGSALSGWTVGIGVRLAIGYSGTTYYKFRGTIEAIEPSAGQYRLTRVLVTCVDWMDDASKMLISGVKVQPDRRTDQLLTSLITGAGYDGNDWNPVPFQPAATSYSTGEETLSYAFDNTEDENTTVMSELQKIANAEWGYIYVKGDTTQGGTLVFESRLERGETTSSALTLDDNDMGELTVRYSRDDVINQAKVTVHPRRIDTDLVVLFGLQTAPEIKKLETFDITANYRDPDQKAVRVGGTNMATPVASTDYTFNSASDGSGTDLTANLDVTVEFGSNAATVQIINGGVIGYLTKFELRGWGMYAYEPVVCVAADSTSQDTYGQKTIRLDVAYQESFGFGQSVAGYIVGQNKDPFARADGVKFTANYSSTLMTHALAREPGDRVSVTETLTGLSSVAHFINAVHLQIDGDYRLRCDWLLQPARSDEFWLLNVAGRTELSTTTRLAWGTTS